VPKKSRNTATTAASSDGIAVIVPCTARRAVVVARVGVESEREGARCAEVCRTATPRVAPRRIPATDLFISRARSEQHAGERGAGGIRRARVSENRTPTKTTTDPTGALLVSRGANSAATERREESKSERKRERIALASFRPSVSPSLLITAAES
jgi:hypothetical protein